jgi:FtsP/CotA-like multicopper oxidase with cupredoxin domain
MNDEKVRYVTLFVLSVLLALALPQVNVFAQTTTTTSSSPTPVPPVANPCPRFTAGSVVHQPPALFSQNGVLTVRFSYQATTDSVGRQLFCFMTPDGLENPTLHVNPGDTLNITVTNHTPFNNVGDTDIDETFQAPNCGDTTFEDQGPMKDSQGFGMTGGSMNIHYHGTNTSPACHEDNVVKTLINPGSTFQYNVHFPTDEPPGLYWYHPHVHMLAEAAVFGGASGALVVDGINNVQPTVAGLRHRVIVIRDQQFTDPGLSQTPSSTTDGGVPQRDLSVNFVPLDTKVATINGNTTVSYTPAVIHMETGEKQFWRICNCTSDAPLDLQVRFDGVAQTIQLVGIDAVPVNSQDGTQPGQLIPVTHFRIPPASRVEFLVNAPPSTVKLAQLVAQFIYSGPLGDTLPTRPLLTMQAVGSSDSDEPLPDDRVPTFAALNINQRRFGGIMSVTPSLTRTVFFEEFEDGSAFFINASGCVTAAGAQCPIQPYGIDTTFDNNHLPAIITTQGSVEKWIVQNHARENHELHQHQIHFKVLSQDNFEVNGSEQAPGINGQFLDMIEIPYCTGDSAGPPVLPLKPAACVTNNGGPPLPYPQVQLLMDFRGPDIGAFVFHCHILGHEDLGMMAIEQVNPKDD